MVAYNMMAKRMRCRGMMHLDFSIRLGRVFDHYLKGVQAPEWMTVGTMRWQGKGWITRVFRRTAPEKAVKEPPAVYAADGILRRQGSDYSSGTRRIVWPGVLAVTKVLPSPCVVSTAGSKGRIQRIEVVVLYSGIRV